MGQCLFQHQPYQTKPNPIRLLFPSFRLHTWFSKGPEYCVCMYGPKLPLLCAPESWLSFHPCRVTARIARCGRGTRDDVVLPKKERALLSYISEVFAWPKSGQTGARLEFCGFTVSFIWGGRSALRGAGPLSPFTCGIFANSKQCVRSVFFDIFVSLCQRTEQRTIGRRK